MFAKLTGTVDELRSRHVVLDVNGVGYLVACSGRTLSQLQGRERATLYVETQVREDAITLYGFLSAEEHDWFLLLTSVQGVGGKVALSIMSVLSPQDLTLAIASHDKKMIAQADGIGPKLADRVCHELKNKVGSMGTPSGSENLSIPANGNVSNLAQDAISALVNLGFNRADAHRTIHALTQKSPEAPLTTLIQQGLRELSA